MFLYNRLLMKFAEKCPPGKRGRPMSKSPESAEAVGIEVCEKQTKSGKTVAYKTGNQLKKERMSKSKTKAAREKLGLKAKGRLSKANLAKIQEIRNELMALRGINENKLESKIEEGNVKTKPEIKPEVKPEATPEVKPEATPEVKPTNFKKLEINGEGFEAYEVNTHGFYDKFYMVKKDIRPGKKSKPYSASFEKGERVWGDNYKFEFQPSALFKDDELELLGSDFSELDPIKIIEYRNGDEDFKRYAAYNLEKVWDVNPKDAPALIEKEKKFKEEKTKKMEENFSQKGLNINFKKTYEQVDPEAYAEDNYILTNKRDAAWLKEKDMVVVTLGGKKWLSEVKENKIMPIRKI